MDNISKSDELINVNKELAFQKEEKKQRAEELAIANEELLFQNAEKEKRAEELVIANKELIFQNAEKEKRAAELVIANKELIFQNAEKEKRAAELAIANKELIFQNAEKEKRAAELVIANKELVFQYAERKKDEELVVANKELVFQNQEKEKRAAELIIANEELLFQNEQKEKMTADLIQRNKDLEQFAYIISHNLRAPVANIIGLSYRLQQIGLPDELRRQIGAGLSTSVTKLDEVIRDLNDILKIRQKVDESKQLIKLEKFVSDIHLSIEKMIENEKAVIFWNFTEAEEIVAIKSYLHSIFYNLISNSLKYRQLTVPPIIKITSRKINGKIVLLFEDNGIGIDLSTAGEHVFGLYKRFHTDRAEGKGMGLYMVKTQVESMGGKISVSSEVNVGTQFRIEFNS